MLVQARGVFLLPIVIDTNTPHRYTPVALCTISGPRLDLDTLEYELSGLGSSLS